MASYTVAIDPGTSKSCWVVIDELLRPIGYAWEENLDVLMRELIVTGEPGTALQHYWRFGDEVDERVPLNLVIEDVTSMGRAVGKDVFETVKWAGRFDSSLSARWISRPAVKTWITGKASTKDAEVREGVINRYGGREKAIGGAKCAACNGHGSIGVPGTRKRIAYVDERDGCKVCDGAGHAARGVLYGFSKAGLGSHGWSALALALTAVES